MEILQVGWTCSILHPTWRFSIKFGDSPSDLEILQLERRISKFGCFSAKNTCNTLISAKKPAPPTPTRIPRKRLQNRRWPHKSSNMQKTNVKTLTVGWLPTASSCKSTPGVAAPSLGLFFKQKERAERIPGKLWGSAFKSLTSQRRAGGEPQFSSKHQRARTPNFPKSWELVVEGTLVHAPG